MELPLEMWDLIFKELRLEDKLQLAKTTTFLEDAFIFSCGKDFRQITRDGLSKNLWPCVAQLCGSYVEDINVDELDAQTCRLLEENCPNLKTLKLSTIKEHNVTLVNSLLLGVKNLRTIYLQLFEDNLVAVTDELTHSLPDLPNLKAFGITLLSSFRRDFLELANVLKMANLEKLKIELISSKFIRPKIKINEIFTSLKRLSYLELYGLDIVSTIGEMETCASLEVLKIENCTFYSVLPNCPSLRYLKVMYSSNVNMLKWFENQSNSLERLDFGVGFLEFHSAWMETNELPALKHLYYKGYRQTKWPNCPKLQFLRLDHQPDNFETFDWISRHAETLKSLNLSLHKKFKSSDLPYLPQLRSVCLRSSYYGLDVAYEWITKQSKTLYSLKVCENLNVVDICQLISRCKNVRTLCIPWHMGLFEASWLPFFDTLKENKVFLDEPFIVKIYFKSYIEENVKWHFLQKLAKSPNFKLCKIQFQ